MERIKRIMGLRKFIFSLFIFFIIIFSLALICFCHDSGHHSQGHIGFDRFQSCHSYSSAFDFSNVFSNSSFELDIGKKGLKKMARFGEFEAKTINVDHFGAVGDGIHDDTKAFKEAWLKACSSAVAVKFVVPPSKFYLLKPITFLGPCVSEIKVHVYGSIEASENMEDYSEDRTHWIVFDSVKNLVVEGGGTIDGNGEIWWQNSCKINPSLPCTRAPVAVTFFECRNVVVQNLRFKNAQNVHLCIDHSIKVHISNLRIIAPEKSPNTDGIHVKYSQTIQISNCTIRTGDDCISIVSGSKHVVAKDTVCGPGHGISIGSLGAGDAAAYVSHVSVVGANISGASNGVRIKTWQGGSGSATHIKFENVAMHDVKNPIIIDQYYCDITTGSCKQQASAVQVKDVVYSNIRGTSATVAAINFNCSETFPCRGITLEDIHLVGQGGAATTAQCNHVYFSVVGKVSPHCQQGDSSALVGQN